MPGFGQIHNIRWKWNLPRQKNEIDHQQSLPQGLVICTFREALEWHSELMTRLLKRINRPLNRKISSLG